MSGLPMVLVIHSYLTIFMFYSRLYTVSTAPIHSNVKSDYDAMNYLGQFGWLDGYNDSSSASLISHDKLVTTIKQFQRFAGLRTTGTLDAQTIKMMNTPRCGVMDTVGAADHARRKKRFVLQGSNWERHRLTYRISSYPRTLSRQDVDKDIEKALQAWSDVTPLTFTKRTVAPVDIEIKFVSGHHGDQSPFDGPSGTLAHAFFPNYGGDAHFDDSEPWSVNLPTGTNLFQVAVHEFGHSLGLSHSDNSDSLMAPFYQGYDPNFQLHRDDIMAVQSLYGEHPGDVPVVPTEPDISNEIPTDDGIPNLCKDATMDAITETRDGPIYVFRGHYYWRLNQYRLGADRGFPRKISWDWDGVPNNVDTALYITHTGYTYFFKGTQYWKFLNHYAMPGYPRYIRDGFPGVPDNLDAAFVWGGNNRVYFMKDGKYWRYGRNNVDIGYPKSMAVWKGLPQRIDAAFQYSINKKTYFFSKSNYYRFSDSEFSVSEHYPRPSALWWLKCKSYDRLEDDTTTDKTDTDKNDDGTYVVDTKDKNSASSLSSLSLLSTMLIVAAVYIGYLK